MNKKNSADLPRQEDAIEIELSAQELITLSCQPKPVPSPFMREPLPSELKANTVAATRRATRRWWRQPLAIACAGAVSFLAIGAAYRGGTAHQESPPEALSQISQSPLVGTESPSARQELKPVRIQNPFDKHEVFEFAAGTTAQEARDAVADTLLKRAIERQAQFDSRHSTRRRAT
jgi:hypothetical protein